MLNWLRALKGVEVETDAYGITRAWRQRLAADGEIRYLALEWLLSLVPHSVHSKKRPGFEAHWTALHTTALC